MSKALVINGANFALNKIETVTLSDIIPCTALSLSDASASFTSIGATKQLTATKTPVPSTTITISVGMSLFRKTPVPNHAGIIRAIHMSA